MIDTAHCVIEQFLEDKFGTKILHFLFSTNYEIMIEENQIKFSLNKDVLLNSFSEF